VIFPVTVTKEAALLRVRKASAFLLPGRFAVNVILPQLNVPATFKVEVLAVVTVPRFVPIDTAPVPAPTVSACEALIVRFAPAVAELLNESDKHPAAAVTVTV
jgi:hypothetical protein